MSEIVSLLTGRIRASGRELAISMAVYGVVALFGATAYAALLYALGLAISSEYGPMAAALSIAGLTVLAASLVLLALGLHQRRLRRLRALRARSA